MSNARWVTTLVLGVIMFAIGLFVAVRPLWSHNAVFLGAVGHPVGGRPYWF